MRLTNTVVLSSEMPPQTLGLYASSPTSKPMNGNKVECEEFSGQEKRGYGGGQVTAASNAARMFEARESAVDLAVGLEEKVS